MKTVPHKLQSLARVAVLVVVSLLTVTLLAIPQTSEPAEAQPRPGHDPVSEVCGGSIALVFDVSRHIENDELAYLKNQATTFVRDLEGAPYQVGLYNYARRAPAEGNRHTPQTSLRTSTGVQTLVNGINALTKPSGEPSGSNWQGALRAVRDDLDRDIEYDHVFFFSGGPPTHNDQSDNTTIRSFSTERVEVEDAQNMAGQVESRGANVIPVGIGGDFLDEEHTIYRGGFLDIFPWWSPDGRELMASMAPSGSQPIFAYTSTSDLHRQLAQRAIDTCIEVHKGIVDGDGDVQSPGADWEFDVSLSGASSRVRLADNLLTTNAEGGADTVINGLPSGNVTVTIREREQGTHALYPVDGLPAQCVVYRPGSGQVDVPVRAAGDNGVQVTIQARDSLVCDFGNRPQVPLRLVKSIDASAQAILDQMGGIPYTFDYVCTDRGQTIAEDSVEVIRPDLAVTLEDSIPVGAECTFTERMPDHDENLHQLTTTWNTVGGEATDTGTDGRTHTFTVDMTSVTDSGGGVLVEVENYFSANQGTLTLRKDVTPGTLPEARVPDAVPVYYYCRYVPDPDARPELGDNPSNPGYIGSGYTEIPRGGEVEIGPFPAGTQCGLEEIAEDGSTPDVPGFSFTPTWSSDACLDYRDAGGSGVRECEANYIRIPTAGEFGVEVTNTYERQTAVLEIAKQLDGEAVSRAEEQSFSFDVVCTDAGETVFSRAGVLAMPGVPARLSGVPVATDCVVTENDIGLPGVDVGTVIDPASVRIEQAGAVHRVTATNTLTYQTGEVTLRNSVDVDDAPAELWGELLADSYPVQARCWPPGETTPIEWSSTVSDGETVSVGTFPVGTICVFTESYEPPAAVDQHPMFSQNSIVVDSTAGVTVDLMHHFAPASRGLMIHNNVGVTAEIPDIDLLIPQTFTFSYRCSDGSADTVNLAGGGMEIIPGIDAGAECEITADVADNDALNRATTWTATDSLGPAAGGSDSGTDGGRPTFTVEFPLDDSLGVTVDVFHTFSPALRTMNVTKSLTINNADGSPASAPVVEAVVGGGRAAAVSYVCTRNDVQVRSGARALNPGQTDQAFLPVNADCVFTIDPQDSPALQEPTTDWSGDGTYRENGFLVTPTAQSGDMAMQVHHTYILRTGGFNLKKKVGGEGVATISGERDFLVDYVCVLNGVTIDGDQRAIGRFENGQAHQVTGLPVGTECVVTESPDSAAEPNAEWSTTWTVATGPTGFETEQPCASATQCRPDPELPNQVTLTITDRGEVAADQHFQGSLVVWNNYVYDKLRLDIDKELGADGPELAAGDEFVFLYRCVHPAFAGSDLEEMGFAPPTTEGTLRVTGEGQATETLPDPDNPGGTVTVPSREIPVGAACTIIENPVGGYDATVNTRFEGPEVIQGENTDPTQNWVAASFTTATDPAGGTHPVTVTNIYERPRGDLLVTKAYDTEVEGTVHEYVDNPTAPYLMSWQCVDPVTDAIYEGTVEVEPDGSGVPVRREDTPEGVDPRLPAGVTCTVAEQSDDRVPAGYEDLVRTNPQVQWLQASGGTDFTLRDQEAGTTITDVALTAGGATRVDFRNAFYVPQVELSIGKLVEGDDEGRVFPVNPDGTGAYGFTFLYRCDFTTLPNQPPPFETEGSFELAHREGRAFDAPVGSECRVSEEAPDDEIQQQLTDLGLRYQPNYVYHRMSETFEDSAREQLAPGDEFILEARLDEEGIAERTNSVVVLNSLYRNDGEIQVQKVNPDGEPLSGAAFSIHQATADGGMVEEPVVEHMEWLPGIEDGSQFTARLGPGSYYLVETRAGEGSELMPQPWRFDVTPVQAQDGFSDLQFGLSNYAEYSGLIEVAEPESGDLTDPWTIRVANIAAGVLPLTGGRGLWPGLLLGTGLLVAGVAGWFWRRNSVM